MDKRYLIKYRIYCVYALFRRIFNRFFAVSNNGVHGAIHRVAVLYSIPLESPRLNTWNDGFVQAVNLLKSKFDITMINIESKVHIKEEYLNSFDFLLVKSNWNWGPDLLLRQKFPHLKVRKGLAIAGVSLPPLCHRQMLYYDVLWYETKWYKPVISHHPNIYHAFGVNKAALEIVNCEKDFDYISIGAFLPHKRMEKIAALKGKVLVVGERYGNAYSDKIYHSLSSQPNCTVLPFVKYEKLGEYICRARTMYIPATVNGGGERAILEARALGLDIKVEPDNPKLRELISCELWDEYYYKEQLLNGMLSIR